MIRRFITGIRFGFAGVTMPGAACICTLCVADRRPLFGEVVGGCMALNDTGRMVAACWCEIPDLFPQGALDETQHVRQDTEP